MVAVKLARSKVAVGSTVIAVMDGKEPPCAEPKRAQLDVRRARPGAGAGDDEETSTVAREAARAVDRADGEARIRGLQRRLGVRERDRAGPRAGRSILDREHRGFSRRRRAADGQCVRTAVGRREDLRRASIVDRERTRSERRVVTETEIGRDASGQRHVNVAGVRARGTDGERAALEGERPAACERVARKATLEIEARAQVRGRGDGRGARHGDDLVPDRAVDRRHVRAGLEDDWSLRGDRCAVDDQRSRRTNRDRSGARRCSRQRDGAGVDYEAIRVLRGRERRGAGAVHDDLGSACRRCVEREVTRAGER